MKRILTLLILITQVALCETIGVTESKNVTVQVGDIIIIKLKENPTTGYSWQMKFTNTDVIEVQENKYIAPNTNLVGAGGERKCLLKALKTGTATIEGEYLRPWEKNIPPVQRFCCKITVNNQSSFTSLLFSRIHQVLSWLRR